MNAPFRPPAIDTDLWPEMGLDYQVTDWTAHLDYQNYVEVYDALCSLAFATAGEDGSISSYGRVFEFTNDPWGEPFEPVLKWRGTNGVRYEVKIEPDDDRLSALILKDPVQAAKKVCEWFVLAQEGNHTARKPKTQLLHALLVRAHFIDEELACPRVIADGWESGVRFILEDGTEISGLDAPAPFQFHHLLGDKGDSEQSFSLEPLESGETLNFESNAEIFTQASLRALGAEANVILSAASLPIIPEEIIAKKARKAEFITSQRCLRNAKIDMPYQSDMRTYEPEAPSAHLVDIVNELADATSLDGIMLTTTNGSYAIAPQSEKSSHRSLYRADRPIVLGDPVLSFHPCRKFASPAQDLEFLKGLHLHLERSADPDERAARDRLLHVIAHAILELTLARMFETSFNDELWLNINVVGRLDGPIEISLGDGGWLKTGITIPADPIFSSYNHSPNAIFGAALYFSQISFERPCGLVARELRKSAEKTLYKLGVTNLHQINEALDKYQIFCGNLGRH